MLHELKIWPKYYDEVSSGAKTFEVRTNDRDFKTGQIVILNEWDQLEECFTSSKPLEFAIGYVLPIDGNKVVFSLLPTIS